MYLQVGGIGISVIPEDQEALGVKAFPAAPEAPLSTLTVQAGMGALDPRVSQTPALDSRGVWQLFDSGHDLRFRFHSAVVGAPYQELTTDYSVSTARIVLDPAYRDPSTQVDCLMYPADELLVVYHLAQRQGALMHACAVRDADGLCFLFPGNSGDGKSTLSRLWHRAGQVTVLSDERVVLRQGQNGVLVYGTPWHGDAGFSSPKSGSLKGVYFLRHGDQNQLRRLSPGLAVSNLLARTFLPFSDPAMTGSIIDLHYSIALSVPCFVFEFVPDLSAIGAIREVSDGWRSNST